MDNQEGQLKINLSSTEVKENLDNHPKVDSSKESIEDHSKFDPPSTKSKENSEDYPKVNPSSTKENHEDHSKVDSTETKENPEDDQNFDSLSTEIMENPNESFNDFSFSSTNAVHCSGYISIKVDGNVRASNAFQFIDENEQINAPNSVTSEQTQVIELERKNPNRSLNVNFLRIS